MLDNLFGEKLCGPYGSCLAFAIDLKIEKYKKVFIQIYSVVPFPMYYENCYKCVEHVTDYILQNQWNLFYFYHSHRIISKIYC